MTRLLRAFYIFNSSGTLLFHHDITKQKSDPKLVGAFLSAICNWARMYSDTGLSLFLTGSMKFVFERSIYSKELIFCLAADAENKEDVLDNHMQTVRENFIHYFWEDLERMATGVIPKEKMSSFGELIVNLFEKKDK